MSEQTQEQQRSQFATEQYNLLVADLFADVPREIIESDAGQRVIGYFWAAATARFHKLWDEREALLQCVEKANAAAMSAGMAYVSQQERLSSIHALAVAITASNPTLAEQLRGDINRIGELSEPK